MKVDKHNSSVSLEKFEILEKQLTGLDSKISDLALKLKDTLEIL
jgi:hypothetical protein